MKFTVLLLALMGTSSLIFAVEQDYFYGIWFHKDDTFFEINKDSLNVFVLNYNSRAALEYKYSIVRWKKNNVNEYYIHTLSENNSEKFFRVYIEKGAHDVYIDNGYNEGSRMKKSSVEELNKTIKNAKAGIRVKDKDSIDIISQGYAKMPASEVKAIYSAIDFRDGKTYKTIKIGSQTWMAENLSYEAKDSKCYESESICQVHGRLYNWATAKTACPKGWHLPTDAEWTKLTDAFSASPAGFGYSGSWWSATEYANGAYFWNINVNDTSVYKAVIDKVNLFSVRCVLD